MAWVFVAVKPITLSVMKEEPGSKTCLTCRKPLKGRSDKKFCDDHCRSNYNNHLNGNASNYVRHINAILKRNRRILEKLLTGIAETTTTTKDKLDSKGFNFSFFTHTFVNQNGAMYFFCYEYGYLSLDNGWLLLVKQKGRNNRPVR
jgi:hypothetical protein